MSLTIKIVRDGITPAILRRISMLTPQRLAAAAGPAVARQVKQHLRSLGTNKRGWPTTNFWAGAAKATNWREDPHGLIVSVNQIGVRQRYHGGRIAPVTKRALTIPISPVSYGKTAADFPGSFILHTKKGAYIVQHGQGTGGETKAAAGKRIRGLGGNAKRRQTAFLNFLFKLSPGVDQKPDPNVLPEAGEVMTTVKNALLRALRASPAGPNSNERVD